MADNAVLNAGAGGVTLAMDDIAGVHHQRVKLQHGADGSATDVSSASPLPVTDANGALEATLSALAGDVGDSADAEASGNGSLIAITKRLRTLAGVEAIAHGANPSAAAAGAFTNGLANRHRIPFALIGHPNVKTAVYITTAAQTDDNLLAAISAGTKYVLLGYGVRLDEATTVGVAVRLGFGASTLPALGASGADGVDGLIDYHPGLVPGSGFGESDCFIVGGDGEEPRLTCEAPTSGTLVVKLRYFTIES